VTPALSLSMNGSVLTISPVAHIKKVSIETSPFQTEEAWVDSVAEANAALAGEVPASAPAGSDPTVVNAGLTELDTQPNGVASAGDEGGNLAGDRWDTGAGAVQDSSIDEGYEIVPRPNDEVDVPAPAPPAAGVPAVEGLLETEKASWADEATAAADQEPVGNQAGESWDLKPAGQTDAAPETNGWAEEAAPAAAGATVGEDGFQEIHRDRPRGRGGRGGEFRGRGGRGRGRGDGEFRGGRGGRGEFRGGRGRGDGNGEYRGRGRGDGEYRGRGGRGRGAPAQQQA
jgi:hypothetical protein